MHFCDFFLALLCGYVYKGNMNGREWLPDGMRQRLLEGTEMASYNDLVLVEGSYVLMCDTDRFNDAEYQTSDEAECAMNLAVNDGYEAMWVGYVERINDQLEIMFVCGESA